MPAATAVGLAKTCARLGTAFGNDLGARLDVAGNPDVPHLPELVSQA